MKNLFIGLALGYLFHDSIDELIFRAKSEIKTEVAETPEPTDD